MKIKVRLFARLSELSGLREGDLDAPEGATPREVFALLGQETPGLQAYSDRLMYAVNAEYVPPDHKLVEGDEVSFIPPVSGGERVVRNHI